MEKIKTWSFTHYKLANRLRKAGYIVRVAWHGDKATSAEFTHIYVCDDVCSRLFTTPRAACAALLQKNPH